MKYWKLDLVTGALSQSNDGVTYSAISAVIWAKFGHYFDGDTGKTQAVIFAKVQDNTSLGVVLGQSSQLGGNLPTIAGYVPTREFRTGAKDQITLLWNGTTVGTISPATGWPAGGHDWATQFQDTPFKEPG